MNLKPILPLLALGALTAAAVTPRVHWEVVPSPDKKKAVQRLTVSGTDSVARLCFNQVPRAMRMLTPGDTLTELVAGYYSVTSPRFGKADTLVFDIESATVMKTVSHTPESFHAVTPGGGLVQAELTRMPMTEAAAVQGGMNWYVSADSLYRLNERLKKGRRPGPFDIVPSFKKVELKKGVFKAGSPVREVIVAHDNPEHYRLVLAPKEAVVEGATPGAVAMGRRMLERRLLAGDVKTLPCAEIEDWPDLPYRALMIDISRDFQKPEVMKRLAELMADYRLNTLHFHFSDDEGWRVEIPGLPELTTYGARRGYTLDEEDFLKQVYCGDGDPMNPDGTGNGHFTRREFVDFLRHCNGLGIRVLPEIESPGHSRAAVKAMEKRFRTTGDDYYRLQIPGDTSRYSTAQDYHDNLMNPAAPGPYRFIDKVSHELRNMYAEAGAPFPGIHIGGDEVPDGAWDGSAEAVAMMDRLGVKGRHGLHGAFVRKVAEMLGERGIPVYGWQDIYTGYGPDHHKLVAPLTGGVNAWVSSWDPDKNVAVKGVRNGYPVILSNVDFLYLDLIYEPDAEEPGLYWGGTVDELTTLSSYPAVMCPVRDGASGRVAGMSAQLWGETVRSPQMMEYQIFPKALGMAERAWNGEATYSDADFNVLVGGKELPRLNELGVNWRLRRPGIIEEGGKLFMNSPYGDAEIRYTLDGTEPNAQSSLYKGAVRLPADAAQVRAVLVKDGKVSRQTVKETGNKK